ncbi:hypothetical protein I7I53_04922 [Histoplasma capsulatum var. duboisii H88]|uniref:Uncharacterized protein n=1 Tax=Ajellomyces capsulatus (strain H88) TaxID=544711 RepID=A0A8A1LXK7_AJEC8|nr:hypothetical protein I7I53_04922 [Histoplasma capsulatum var. duboisii H88]
MPRYLDTSLHLSNTSGGQPLHITHAAGAEIGVCHFFQSWMGHRGSFWGLFSPSLYGSNP